MDELESYIMKHSQGLYRYLLLHTGDHYTAEDLLQETFLKAFLAIQTNIPDNLEAWLMTIAKYTMYDHYKKQKRIVIKEAEFFERQPFVASLERLDQLELSMATVKMLKRLPSQQQKAIALVHIRGFPYEEVSEMLDIPVNTLKSQVRRGRESLKQWKNARSDGQIS
ncbi:RNA polymerase sigma factor [Vagococcus sp. BWB3-3]|uniref:RNA polymerase sigma factor n=1 Tax=Vagococcus allomyrinae TaxID=2794353 RepID=A0A940SV20_9ENTE|nr:RNA polymerase sigma factor [Vagococcus allomyrinae]MBP1041880.1 RNA polymerase sigma factor [Vagococcus allomyrinae]